ncbi:hypothetical protein THASP1DRAFT_27950 [Thamnocephalis sphaerospora]|uniref:Uncharacterized protein n=1 Tax=Thamnocephalis sphaerospora TaxID=78915 RepID=A0A4P9XVI1_9FUNG|nr:hypothetical protein THASP1DRAFT_27950 [Thamnocephalis sphaerospora]|eukprot:RKP10266.1 hypothetical protein THASP1DRAFT_27950 [Thamnocephalis sphaerospora]
MAPSALANTSKALDRPVATVNGRTVTGKHVLVTAAVATLLAASGYGLFRFYKQYRRRWRRELLKRSADHEREELADKLKEVKKDLNSLLDGDLKMMYMALDDLERKRALGKEDSSSSSSSSSDDDDDKRQRRATRREVRQLRKGDQAKLRQRFADASNRLNGLVRELDQLDDDKNGVTVEEIVETHAPDGTVTTTTTTTTEGGVHQWTDKLSKKHTKLRTRVHDELHALKARFKF